MEFSETISKSAHGSLELTGKTIQKSTIRLNLFEYKMYPNHQSSAQGSLGRKLHWHQIWTGAAEFKWPVVFLHQWVPFAWTFPPLRQPTPLLSALQFTYTRIGKKQSVDCTQPIFSVPDPFIDKESLTLQVYILICILYIFHAEGYM